MSIRRRPAIRVAHLLGVFLWSALLGVTAGITGQTPVNPATVPQDRTFQRSWKARHEAVLQEVAEHPDASLIMVGDSITQQYTLEQPPFQNYKPVWDEFYAPRGALNLGFSGDTTSYLLWRLEHGELSGLRPKVAVLLIGTNNTGWANQTAEETEGGIDAVIASLEKHLPETHILLLGILPSDVSLAKTIKDQDVNRYLAASYGESHRVTYLDIGSVFLENGHINTALYADPQLQKPGPAIHPDSVGQRRMAEAIEPTLATLLQESPRIPLGSMKDINTALIPVEMLEQDSYDWYARHHQELLQLQKQRPRVVLIGDSITHFWGGLPSATQSNGPEAWKLAFGDMNVLNLGFGWDRTQNVLWRLRQGELDGVNPEWVVIHIGTNNFAGTQHARANTPAEVAEGVEAVVDQVRQKCPGAHIIVMGIFPRGAKPDNWFRGETVATNRLLKDTFATRPDVTWLDIGSRFLNAEGILPVTLMSDGTHPTDSGYKIWAAALAEAGLKP